MCDIRLGVYAAVLTQIGIMYWGYELLEDTSSALDIWVCLGTWHSIQLRRDSQRCSSPLKTGGHVVPSQVQLSVCPRAKHTTHARPLSLLQSDAVKTAVSSPRSHAMDSTRKRIMAIFFDLLTSAWSAGEIADNSCELVRCYHFDNWSREWSLNNSCSHWGFFFMFVHQI